ncbi:hydroxyisourate hydrolase [Nakamurella sp. GG22]
MSAITTHVLDAALGRPAAGVPVRLEHLGAGAGHPEGTPPTSVSGVTDSDGRVGSLGPDHIQRGNYRLTFDTATYFQQTGQTGFYPTVTVTFTVIDPARHHHVPVLLSPFAYSTYQGS